MAEHWRHSVYVKYRPDMFDAGVAMATEGTPTQGMKVRVWSETGVPIFEGVITGITPATKDKPAEITVKALEASEAT